MLRRLKDSVASELPQKREHHLPGVGVGRCSHAAWGGLCVAMRAVVGSGGPFARGPCPPCAVMPSPYQRALFGLMQQELQRSSAGGAGKGSLRGVSNVLMEMRNVCNHPLIRRAGVSDTCAKGSDATARQRRVGFHGREYAHRAVIMPACLPVCLSALHLQPPARGGR